MKRTKTSISLNVIRRINRAVVAGSNPEQALSTCVTALGQVLAASRCFIHQRDEEGMYPVTHEFTAGETSPVGISNTLLMPISYLAHQSMSTIFSDDVLADSRFAQPMDRQIHEGMDVRSAAAAPIATDGRELGQIVVHFSGQAHKWTPAELDLIETVAGQAAMIMQMARNLSEKERLSGALAGMNEDLSKLYVELARKDEQLERFMSFISHDLRAPVVAIQGLVDLLKAHYESEPPDSKPRRYLEIILKSAAQINSLTTALIDYRRLGQSTINLEEVDTAELVREIWQRATVGIDDIDLDIFSDLPRVSADRAKLSRIFQNLIENAVKYRKPRGRARVDVTCQETETMWQFAVNDDGIGFSPQDADRLFDIFTRLKQASNRPGSGIGLTSVLEIARLHGGNAWATGRPGKGATFYFTLAKEPPAEHTAQWREER